MRSRSKVQATVYLIISPRLPSRRGAGMAECRCPRRRQRRRCYLAIDFKSPLFSASERTFRARKIYQNPRVGWLSSLAEFLLRTPTNKAARYLLVISPGRRFCLRVSH